MKKLLQRTALAAAGLFVVGAQAGPFILAGTDADDHGFANSSGNQDGWFFMQRALENLAAGVTNGNKTVYTLGSSSSALTAANSAFSLSSLAGAGGRTVVNLDGAAAINTFFSGVGVGSAGILMLDSGDGNVTGGLSADELTALTTNASAINSFVGSGGGLFSQANGYSWLSGLLPSLSVATDQETGLALTASGSAAFPGLNNADLSAGPYHQNFLNVGSIPVLATGIGSVSRYNVIIGASGGSITNPVPAIPEPSTYALMLAGLGVVGFMARRRRAL